jgi:hypothetical protein
MALLVGGRDTVLTATGRRRIVDDIFIAIFNEFCWRY